MEPDFTAVTNPDITIDDYMIEKSFKSIKFCLRTKKWELYDQPDDVSDEEQNVSTKSENDDLDFDDPLPSFSKSPRATSTPKESNQERLALIEEQNKQFEASLQPDRKKELDKKSAEYRHQYLKRRQESRLIKVPPEPSLNEDVIVVMINYITLNRISRLFLAKHKMDVVYFWVNSMALEPELFELFIMSDRHSNIILLDPNDPITRCEKQMVMMREAEKSNFTIDVFSANLDVKEPENETPGTSGVNELKVVRCPVCSEFHSVEIIEEHAAACADHTFPIILSSGEDSDLEDDLPVVPFVVKESVFSLKDLKRIFVILCGPKGIIKAKSN